VDGGRTFISFTVAQIETRPQEKGGGTGAEGDNDEKTEGLAKAVLKWA